MLKKSPLNEVGYNIKLSFLTSNGYAPQDHDFVCLRLLVAKTRIHHSYIDPSHHVGQLDLGNNRHCEERKHSSVSPEAGAHQCRTIVNIRELGLRLS